MSTVDPEAPSAPAPMAATVVLSAGLGVLWVPMVGVLPPLPSGLVEAWPWLLLAGGVLLALGWRRQAASAPPDRSPRRRLAAVAAGYAATLLLFGWPLAALWQGQSPGDNVTLGWLPLLDARAYESGAFALWLDGRLDTFSSRRPLFVGVLAGLFAPFDGAVRPPQLAFAWAGATAAWLAGRAVAATHGGPAGLLVVVFLAAAAYEHTGAWLTEQIGLPLGALGFALIWTAAHRPSPGRQAMLALGLAAIALGLNARAGAFFVLPALCLWVALLYRGQGLRQAAVAFALVAAAGLSAFAANNMLYRSFGEPGGLPFGNFAPTLYGVVVGNQGWTQVYRDHPALRLAQASEREHYLEVYRLAGQAVRDEPLTALLGVAGTYNEFIIELDWTEMFGPTWARLPAMALILAGLWSAWRRRREAGGGLLLAATLGILASVPMLADGGHRIYAATHAWSAALMAIGFVALTGRLGGRAPVIGAGRPAAATWSAAGSAAAGLVLVAVVAAGPLTAGRGDPPAARSTACPDGALPVTVMARPVPPVVFADGADVPRGLVEGAGMAADRTPPFAVTRAWDANSIRVVWLIEPGGGTALQRLSEADHAGCVVPESTMLTIAGPLAPIAADAP